MKNVCIAGYGAIGPIHARALRETENARFYAVCDIDPVKNDLCKKEYNVKTYTDFNEMLRDESISSVHICTPHYLHFKMISDALDAGKTVVAEKPVTMTRQEFYLLRTRKDYKKICVVMQNRLNPCVCKFKSIISEGVMGDIKNVKGFLTWRRDEPYYNKDSWRGKWATEGGGVLINQAVHTLDLISYLAGDIASVSADMMNYSLKGVIETEDTVSAYLNFKSGIKGLFFATNAYGRNSAPEIEITFEKGTVRYYNGKLTADGELLETDSAPSYGKSYWGMGHVRVIKNFYDKNVYFTLDDISNTMNAMFAIYESADGVRGSKAVGI